jgi:antitoxin MazE
MKTRIRKWGNSLAVRIPKGVADQAGIFENGPVELSFADGNLVVRPIAPPSPTLEELVRGITPENLHGEWNTGTAVGKEIW